jgi:hypothetical protein
VMRPRDVAGRSALATAVLALSLAGCSLASPATIATPYPAADGVGTDLPGTGVKLRDFLVVGTEKGAPAEVIGAVVNNGSTPIEVSLQADLGATAQPTQTVVRVAAQSITLLGPQQRTRMEIPDLPVVPGSLTGISAATAAGGRADFSVPVLLPHGPYAGLTPSPTPTETPTPTGSPTSSKTKKKSSDTTSTQTDTPTATSS